MPALAEYLLSYAGHLAGAGEAVEAVPLAEEAVGLLRRLAEEDPEAFLPGSPPPSTASAATVRR